MAGSPPLSAVACKAGGVCVKDGMMLLVKKKGLDWWLLPGGKVEPFETPENALAREFKEELSCNVRNLGMIGCFIDKFIERPEDKIVVLAFKASPLGKVRKGNEIVQVVWMPFEDVFDGQKVASGAKGALLALLSQNLKRRG